VIRGRLVALIVVLAAIISPYRAAADDAPAKDSWADLRFLIGDWDAEPASGLVSGHFSLAEDLGGAVLVRKNHAEYAPKPGEKSGTIHDDLMFVYSEGGKHRATFLDPEGHAIHYGIAAVPHGAVFESDAVPGAPRYKLTYEEKEPGLVAVTFTIAPPGGEYKTYVSGVVKKRAATTPPG
jgi:hypothetical protein